MGIEEIMIKPLEKATENTALPSEECSYPKCEKCRWYAEYGGARYCTVEMVVSRQIWLLTEERLRRMDERLTELEKLVTDEILGIAESQTNSVLVCANCIHYKENNRCKLHKMDVTPGSYCNKGLFKP